MRRAKTGPEEILPQLWEPDFRTYLWSPSVRIDRMLADYERRAYRGQIEDGASSVKALIRLHPPHLAALKRAIARRIAEAGGEFKTPSVVVRSADGLTFTTHLPGG